MSLSISFYRPLDYFGSVFNKMVTWVTSGEFCHCELLIHTTPEDIMSAVKEIYASAQKGEYDKEDCVRIIAQIERNFFDTGFRKMATTQKTMVLSFSLLWGHPMMVRVLQETSHDSWFRIPQKNDRLVSMLQGPQVTREQYTHTLKFSIEELGKHYNNTGAICSVLPSLYSSEHKTRSGSYFCSEFVVMVYQRLGFMQSLDAEHTTPNSLFSYVKSSTDTNETSE